MAVAVTVEPVVTYKLVDELSLTTRELEIDSLQKRKFTPPIEAVSECKTLVAKVRLPVANEPPPQNII